MATEVDTAFASLAAALRASTVRVHDGDRGSGSGVVWSSGLVVTNAHVAAGRTAVVETPRGRFAARVVRRDTERDLAALRVAAPPDVRPVRVRDSRTLQPGELVVAVGNPLGLTGALTSGVVQRSSARWVVADVRLAPGNSGGPLADAEGRVVGVNSMVAGRLALAVPTSAIADFLDTAPRRLGVALVPVALRRAGGQSALLVTAVEPGSVADRAGLQLGDAIVASDAAALRTAASLDVLRGETRLMVRLPWPSEDERAA